MDFQLNDELTLVRDMSRSFAEGELVSRATKHDRQGFIDAEVFAKMGELGLWGLTVPEAYGGAGLGNMALAVVLEEVNRVCASTGVTLSVHNSLLGAPINKFGTEAQKREWLPKLATGQVIGAYCLTEPNAGSDAASLRTSARLDGDHWVIDGTKIWVTNGGTCGVMLVYARTDPTSTKARGISAFIVPKGTKGITVGKPEKKCGIRGSSTTEMLFDGVRVPKANLLGELHEGFKIAMDTLDGGRIGIASQAVGIARACLEAATKYAKEREQFGTAIANFQAIQWKLADMSTRIEASRMLVMKAAWLRDRGERCTQASAQAKLYASQTANFCADECLQIHGGAGYMTEYGIERAFRDARLGPIGGGTDEIMREILSKMMGL